MGAYPPAGQWNYGTRTPHHTAWRPMCFYLRFSDLYPNLKEMYDGKGRYRIFLIQKLFLCYFSNVKIAKLNKSIYHLAREAGRNQTRSG